MTDHAPMVPRFSYVARGYKLGVLMQDLVSERDQSWVTCDAILHTLIIPQFGKNATCALHVLFNQQRFCLKVFWQTREKLHFHSSILHSSQKISGIVRFWYHKCAVSFESVRNDLPP
jgi:hypothetical protein